MSVRRYDQCDTTCTADCGHCKGAGRPLDYHRDVTNKAIRAVREPGAKYLPAVMQFTLADAAWLHEQGRPELAGEVLAAWAQASMSATSAEAAGVTVR